MRSLLYDRRWIALFFSVGLVFSIVGLTRSQVAGDQLNLLSRGWYLALQGEWIPFGNTTSGGGVNPGGLASLLVGLPLMVWQHHRAPTVLIVLSQVLAYWLLDRLVRRILGPEARFLLAVLFWLNPWRVYYSAHLWSPNYLFFLGSLHLWTGYRLRKRADFWWTLFHVLVIGAALQLRISALPLAVSTLLLWWRGYVRINLRGAITACLLLALSLVPWVLAIQSDPTLLPVRSKGFLGYGLVMVYPILQGILNWLRYSSLSLTHGMFCLDFTSFWQALSYERMELFWTVCKWTLSLATIPVAIWANARLWSDAKFVWKGRWQPQDSDRSWLEGVVRHTFLASLIVVALSPASISRWHLLSVFHIAILPLVLAGGDYLSRGISLTTSRFLKAYLAMSLIMGAGIVVGSPPYRCGDPRCGQRPVTMPALRSDHPMLDDLEIRQTCPLVVNEPGGWWPDILPEGELMAPHSSPSKDG